ncbi:hypothetical protein AAGG74_18830 [Bacillus mexicanus]|uniref:hypothetical protein n=1 Tax=Bacillus mexicanus TaxID=2834415 RepID=UPI003D210AF6
MDLSESIKDEISAYIKNEKLKRSVSEEMKELLQNVYENLFIKNAQLKSLETSIEALGFAELDSSFVEQKKEELIEEIELNKSNLTTKVEKMITEENKEDFIKIIKKTKFIQREPFDFKFFTNMRSETVNAITEGVYEEVTKLSPYKIADLVQSEYKQPQIKKFLDLYKKNYLDSEISNWINQYGINKDDQQKILNHFDEIKTNVFLTEDMINRIAIRWSTMIGIEVSSPSEKDKKAIEEVSEIIKNNAHCIL